jgi:hypothetical protein
MSGFTRELLRDIHQIVNEATRPLSPEMEERVKKLAFELADKYTNVDEDKVVAILTRMAKQGDDLNDLESLEQELEAMGTS